MELVPKPMFESLINWLNSHSTSVKQVGNELLFKHTESRSSVVVLKNEWLDGLIPVHSPLLQNLFNGCLAASIDNGHVIIGSIVEGGITLSHGYRIPDLNELRITAARLGMQNVEASEAFMIEAAWMFLYGIDAESKSLLRFDRDFDSYETVSSIENVMDDWWQIELSSDQPK